MFRGGVLGITYYTPQGYVDAYNEAVDNGLLKDKNGRVITRKKTVEELFKSIK